MKLTVKQAAQRACCSEALIYSWCQSGVLPHFRLGRQGRRGGIRIEVEDLDAAMASFKVGTREPAPPPAKRTARPPFKHLRLN